MVRRAALAVCVVVLMGAAVVVAPVSARAASVGSELVVRSVGTTDFPLMRVRLGVPPALVGGGEPNFSVKENGSSVEVLSVTAEKKEDAFEVVLVVDSSGSMKGRPMRDAKQAAGVFLDRLPPQARVAVIAVGSEPRMVTPFTEDRADARSGIAALEPKGETAVYDALLEATRLKSTAEGSEALDRTIVLLSDGGDTTSVTKLNEIARTVRSALVPVLTIAISSPEFNPTALRLVSKQSGGRLVAVSDTSELAANYQSVAEELSGGYLATFRSARPRTKDLDIDIVAEADGRQASASFVTPNPLFVVPIPVATRVFAQSDPNPVFLFLALFFAFASVAVLVAGIVLLLTRPKSGLERVRYYDQLHAGSAMSERIDPNSIQAKLIGAVDAVATRHGFTGLIGQRLERAGATLRPAEWITLHLVGVVLGGFLVQLVAENTLMSAATVAVLAVVPLWWLDRAGTKRTEQFNDRLPDVLNMIAGGLRTGWGLQQAINLVVEEGTPPASEEFRRVEIETRLGIPLERALENMASRLQSEPFHWVVTAIAIQREVGGNLAEVLDTVAASLRDREALRRQVVALTAEGNISAAILIALPFVVAVFLMIVNPGYLMNALQTPAGQAMTALAGVLLLVGFVWLRATSRIEY